MEIAKASGEIEAKYIAASTAIRSEKASSKTVG
jgi:hypothetical protein